MHLRARGVYAVDLASELGWSEPKFSRIRLGRQRPSGQDAQLLADALGLPVFEVFPDLQDGESPAGQPGPQSLAGAGGGRASG